MVNISYLSIGSNLGDRLVTIQSAFRLLDENSHIELVACSSLYETDPVGYADQDCFLNAVFKVKTDLKPEELLRTCMQIEQELGRKREVRWGPRTLDLDILLYNHENIETEILSVPHPRMQERAFVLVPLMEVDPDIKLPQMYTPLRGLLEQIPDKEGVRLWKAKNGEGVFALFES
ncbi:2-amino-4-hydroxy-6-hydroxymethyldihydropteridine diphosphokinase [Peribacillus butanolivorans]|uniref:2-amino-4-hydroxy-6- hydroxymethyldihydropteridine diphosphokinase n=1 Tax=Peribacillus butanolivorans TaxID=421767 RepID=UPI002E243830|nr:2-amino-4-hydroxy-6-hydroxymethyldihydropteridine diphosphokinase [Peribacillus butanolivorans]MED3690015.1 2-amino-4-hydroxy-6-hydroxymethyldihydropteridine diphosphokinase [Peribacillus butanolivorans]